VKKLGIKESRQIASALSQAHAVKNTAGRALHDRVGPLLMGAGMRLQLLSMDQPDTAEAVAEVLSALDQAMEQVREVSQSLAPSPVYRVGLQAALEKLIEELQADFHGTIRLKFSTNLKLELTFVVQLYDAIAAVLREAIARPGSNKVNVAVTGTKRLVTARIQDNGRKALKPRDYLPRLLAEEANFLFSQSTRKGTIVLIRHGIPRPTR